MTGPWKSSPRAHLAAELATVALSADEENRLHTIVAAVLEELGADAVQVSMMADEQVSAASCGKIVTRTEHTMRVPLENTACTNVLRTQLPQVIPDARSDARVSSLPVVERGFLGAYIGAPLVVQGMIVGVLCAIQSRPRAWTSSDLELLQRHADEVEKELLRLVVLIGS
ncbi:GAF domain-containing protein [Rudaeicoccus suwonensis]|uniref:GAF domain-containing protein n=1 Tax=Rudaeicoccus suwonensis TaxID=657409 RepID=UPI001FE85C53|nr:GAF domain-containing protein [Rudaeicoccus suwonensis]